MRTFGLLLPVLFCILSCSGDEAMQKPLRAQFGGEDSAQGGAKTAKGGAKAVKPKLNRLAHEKSLYLRQHATNPVDWYPWGEEPFEKARQENKPVFLSIGYSSCHWCHVMEQECFSDQEVADLLNKHFVCIKVDREERPDIDEVYMNAAVYGMRVSGGWPLSLWLTPDRKPFYAGTYFPKKANPLLGARIGFMDLLQHIAEAWKNPEQHKKILAAGKGISESVQEMYDMEEPEAIEAEAIKTARQMVELSYDEEYGGFAGPPRQAPKFPGVSTLELLLRYGLRHKDQQARAMVEKTLEGMLRGGIHDHIGGGFHRYSVTREWSVPHFEKMLYDNGQLLGLYAWAYLITGEQRYATTARDIALWVQREMTDPKGGFYSAQDADNPGGPEGEGLFYAWDPAEIKALFPEQEAKALTLWFHITEQGNWFVHGRQENPGKSLLRITETAEAVAKQAGMAVGELRALVTRAKKRMYTEREKRSKPLTDKKILTSWNGLMISGLCRAYQALGDPGLLESARKAARFVKQSLTGKEGRLSRRWAGGEAGEVGVLPDYADMIAAYLDLYESTFETKWLQEALRLNKLALDRFYDPGQGGFFSTPSDGEKLIARGRNGFDAARPSGNGVMAMNLLRLAELNGDLKLREKAKKTLDYFGARVGQSAIGYAAILNALDFFQAGTREIFIAGAPGDARTQALLQAVWTDPRPNRVIALVVPGIEKLLPPALGKTLVDGKPAAYVCVNFACKAPVTDPAALTSKR